MPAAGRPASGYSGASRPAGGAAYRIGAGRVGGGQPRLGRNPYQMQPGRAYLGGSADFDESTGQYRSGRQPGMVNLGRGGGGGGQYGFGGPPGPGNIEYGAGGFGRLPSVPAGYFGGGQRGMDMRAQYQAARQGGPEQRQQMMQQMQQMMQQRAMREMQQRAMARLMMGGGYTY